MFFSMFQGTLTKWIPNAQVWAEIGGSPFTSKFVKYHNHDFKLEPFVIYLMTINYLFYNYAESLLGLPLVGLAWRDVVFRWSSFKISQTVTWGALTMCNPTTMMWFLVSTSLNLRWQLPSCYWEWYSWSRLCQTTTYKAWLDKRFIASRTSISRIPWV